MLSVCLPYHAGLAYLEACLRSIEAHPPECDYEILVVEDASPEPCTEVVRRFPRARIVVNDVNLGFAVSANRAVASCRGDRILLLNPDTRVLPGAIARLDAHLSSHPDVAAVGPMVLNADGTFQPQCKRGRLTPASTLGYALRLDRWMAPGSRFADYLRPAEPLSLATDTEALSGSCMMMTREALAAIGGFDESLFLYGEDLDLCYRFRDAGWKVRYLPDARVVHFGGQGGTALRYLRSLYHYHRSTYVVLKRNAGPAFALYGWAFALAFGARFMIQAIRRLLGRTSVGTRKANGLRPVRMSDPDMGYE